MALNPLDRLVRDVEDVKRQLAGRSQLNHSSLENTAIPVYDDEGQERLRIGAQDDGTHAIVYVQGPPPPAPSAPLVEVDGPVLRVRWDGQFQGGAAMPEDFTRIDVHVEGPSSVRVAGTLTTRAGSEVVLKAAEQGEHTITLIAVSASETPSDPSEPVEVEVKFASFEGVIDDVIENARGGLNYYQPTPPEGVDHTENDLWFDTSEDEDGLTRYTPHRWDGQQWVSIGDERVQVIKDAQAEFESELDTVRTTADGKNSITWSPDTPSGEGKAGDTWFRMSSNQIIGHWRHSGSGWVSMSLDATVIPNLDAGKITSGFIDSERVAAESITTDKIAVGAITAESGVVGSLDLGVATVGYLHGSRIESKTVKTEQLAADAIDGMLITGAVHQSSHEHPKSIQNSTGFHVTDEDGQDQISLTTKGGDFLALRTPEGSTLANISDEGIISGRGLNIEEDPVFMGKELLGTQAEFSHPSEFEADGMLDFVPRGMIARAYRNNAGRSAFTNTETNILEFSYDHEPSRAYKIVIAPFSIYVDGDNTYGYLNIYLTTDGSRPRADGNPTFRQLVRNPGSSRALYDFGGEFYHVTDLPPTTVRILYTFTADGGQVSFFGNPSGAAIRTWVEDMGLSVPDTGIDRNERREITSTAPPPAPTEPERRNYTKTYTATGGRTFWTSGGYRTDNTQYAYQGNGPYGGSQRSIILFPNMTGDLSGAEITSMRVYLYFEHWYYSSGGEAKIHAHSRSELPTSIPAMQGMVTSSNWPKPGGRWVNIPKEYWNNFRTGDYKGIGLGNPTGNRRQYGYARISSTKIEVKYRK